MTPVTRATRRPPVQLAVLVASAGGLHAFSTVLRDLPTDFAAAVVVQQHLGGLTSVLPTILGRQTRHRVSWVRDGQAVAPGRVLVCPPKVHLELTPDGRCHLRETEPLAEQRFDVLLASVARSYGARGVAVVLSGSGQDGAAGTVSMKRAGATVIAQSPGTAQYPSMPLAAARAGADLVLPIHDIARALAEIVAGGPLPTPAPAPDGTGAIPQRAPGKGDTWGAAARAEMARLRAAELRRTRRGLAEGFVATAQSVAIARRRAQESLRRAQFAHRAAEEAAARWGR
ncbi:chemotaxis protein CheB [Mycobacterium terramassiliense]|uniref:protein-glutamate methylesterase n=1 Tax=Mycobacterium terramassiliense TaxID=1841859 RepID=A0A2U3NA13_9MYCO|nr:chemotaxis protein CheB [Mycobacterium terramassiliense]SPM28333.1 chemotaxis protein CheB [Mycobacterium terramassiliense]